MMNRRELAEFCIKQNNLGETGTISRQLEFWDLHNVVTEICIGYFLECEITFHSERYIRCTRCKNYSKSKKCRYCGYERTDIDWLK